MAECAVCGEGLESPFSCSYCGVSLCGDHRLPENHDCDGVGATTPLREKKQVSEQAEGIDAPEPMELDDSQVLGTSRDPDLDRAPDVEPDGSVAGEDADSEEKSESGGLFAWLRSLL